MTIANIADLRSLARARLPRMIFDYIDGGSYGESTLRANKDDFSDILLRQRVLRDVSCRDLSAHFLGATQALPMMLGPVGFSGLFWRNGEIAANRAAAALPIPFCLSTFSIGSIERVSRSAARPVCFQSYIFRDRGVSSELLERAASLGVDTLFLTVDTAVSGLREKDVANGFRLATRLSGVAASDILAHPRWATQLILGGMPKLGNFPDLGAMNLMAQAAAMTANIDPSLTWRDVAWLRDKWAGRLVIKGIMSAEDAATAADIGADAVVVSNHGGRQLDGARSSISALRQVVEVVGERLEVLFDGGIQRGTQIIKALALGANAVLLGRAYAYGLAAAGEVGVAKAIQVISAEMDITLALMGFTSIQELRAAGPAALDASKLLTRS